MARLFTSGLELQSTTAGVEWTTLTGSPAIDTSIRHGDGSHGLASLRVNPTATTANLRHQILSAAATSTTWYGRAYIYIATAPGATVPVFEFTNGTTGVVQIRMGSDRHLELWAGGVLAKQGNSSNTLQPNQWYCIELKAVCSAGSLATDGEARINGEVFATFTGQTGGSPQSIRIGMSSSATCDIYYDDVALNDSSGSFQTSYPGAGFVIHLKPNATGTSAQWHNATATGANNFNEVDETTPDDVTSYVDTAGISINNTDSYNIDATPAALDSNATINCVSVGVRYARSAASTADIFNVQWTAGGNTDSGSAIQPNSSTWKTNANAAPALYTLTSYDMPGASTTAITKSDLDSAEIGIVATTVANSNDARVSALWMVVDYLPSTYVESIWATSLTTAQSSAGVTSLATSSVTPIANHLVFGWAVSRTAANDPNHATATGCGLTWVEVQSINFDNAGSQKRLTVLRAMGSSPSAGAVTFDFNGQTQSDIVCGVIDVQGTDTSGTNGSGAIVQNATNTDTSGAGTTLTATLAAFSATDNATIGFLGIGNVGTLTPGTGFTTTGSNATAANLTGAAEFKESNDTTVDMTFSVGGELGIIAVEIKSATRSVSIPAIASGSLGTPIYPIWKTPVNAFSDFTSLVTATGETITVTSNGFLGNGLNINQNNSASDEVGVRIEQAHNSSPAAKRFEYWFKVRNGAAFTGEICTTHSWYDTAGSAYGGDLLEIRIAPVSIASGYRGNMILKELFGNSTSTGSTSVDLGVWNKLTVYVKSSHMELWLNRALTREAMISHASIASNALGAIATGKYFAQGLNGTMIFDNFALRSAPTGAASTVGGYLTDAYDGWMQRYLAFEGGIVRPFDEGNNDVPSYASAPDIVSEGQAYGMLLAVQHNDKNTFDLIENFNRNVMERTNYPSSTASLRAQGAHLMGYHYNAHISAVSLGLTAGPNSMYDWNFATDADIDRAKALMYAWNRWGRTSGASIDYLSRAKEVLVDLKNWGHTNYNGLQYLHGDYYGWLNNPHETNPSYLDMTTMRLGRQMFSDQQHDQSIQGMYDMIRQSTSSTGSLMTQWGLVPDWIKWNTTNGKVELNASRDTRYSYDAFRTVYRMYLDYDFYQEKQAKDLLSGQLYISFASEYNRSGQIQAEYNHDGSVYGAYEKTLFYAVNLFPFLVAGATTSGASIYQGKVVNTYYSSATIPSGSFWSDAPSSPSTGSPTYFNNSWVQLAVGAKERFYQHWGYWRDTSSQLW